MDCSILYGSRTQQRAAIADRVLRSEEQYNKRMVYLQDTYMRPLQQDPSLLSTQEFNILFNVIEDLIACSTCLVLRLTEESSALVEHGRSVADLRLGTIFCDVVQPHLKEFEAYAVRFQSDTGRTLAQLRGRKKFANFTSSVENTNAGQPDLLKLLRCPLSRIAKYHFHLRILLQCLEDDDADLSNLRRFVELSGEHVRILNEHLDAAVNHRQMSEVLSRVVGLKGFDLLKANRKYIYEGPLIKRYTRGHHARYFFLLSDMLLYCSATNLDRGEGLKYKDKLMFDFALGPQVEPIPDDPIRQRYNGFRVSCGRSSLFLYAGTPEERNHWVELVNAALEELKDTLGQKTSRVFQACRLGRFSVSIPVETPGSVKGRTKAGTPTSTLGLPASALAGNSSEPSSPAVESHRLLSAEQFPVTPVPVGKIGLLSALGVPQPIHLTAPLPPLPRPSTEDDEGSPTQMRPRRPRPAMLSEQLIDRAVAFGRATGSSRTLINTKEECSTEELTALTEQQQRAPSFSPFREAVKQRTLSVDMGGGSPTRTRPRSGEDTATIMERSGLCKTTSMRVPHTALSRDEDLDETAPLGPALTRGLSSQVSTDLLNIDRGGMEPSSLNSISLSMNRSTMPLMGDANASTSVSVDRPPLHEMEFNASVALSVEENSNNPNLASVSGIGIEMDGVLNMSTTSQGSDSRTGAMLERLKPPPPAPSSGGSKEEAVGAPLVTKTSIRIEPPPPPIPLASTTQKELFPEPKAAPIKPKPIPPPPSTSGATVSNTSSDPNFPAKPPAMSSDAIQAQPIAGSPPTTALSMQSPRTIPPLPPPPGSAQVTTPMPSVPLPPPPPPQSQSTGTSPTPSVILPQPTSSQPQPQPQPQPPLQPQIEPPKQPAQAPPTHAQPPLAPPTLSSNNIVPATPPPFRRRESFGNPLSATLLPKQELTAFFSPRIAEASKVTPIKAPPAPTTTSDTDNLNPFLRFSPTAVPSSSNQHLSAHLNPFCSPPPANLQSFTFGATPPPPSPPVHAPLAFSNNTNLQPSAAAPASLARELRSTSTSSLTNTAHDAFANLMPLASFSATTTSEVLPSKPPLSATSSSSTITSSIDAGTPQKSSPHQPPAPLTPTTQSSNPTSGPASPDFGSPVIRPYDLPSNLAVEKALASSISSSDPFSGLVSPGKLTPTPSITDKAQKKPASNQPLPSQHLAPASNNLEDSGTWTTPFDFSSPRPGNTTNNTSGHAALEEPTATAATTATSTTMPPTSSTLSVSDNLTSASESPLTSSSSSATVARRISKIDEKTAAKDAAALASSSSMSSSEWRISLNPNNPPPTVLQTRTNMTKLSTLRANRGVLGGPLPSGSASLPNSAGVADAATVNGITAKALSVAMPSTSSTSSSMSTTESSSFQDQPPVSLISPISGASSASSSSSSTSSTSSAKYMVPTGLSSPGAVATTTNNVSHSNGADDTQFSSIMGSPTNSAAGGLGSSCKIAASTVGAGTDLSGVAVACTSLDASFSSPLGSDDNKDLEQQQIQLRLTNMFEVT